MWDRINKFAHSHAVLSVCILCVIFYVVLLALSFPIANMATSGGQTARTLVWLILSAITVWLMQKMHHVKTTIWNKGENKYVDPIYPR